jgi:hypothetical protein
MGFEAPCGRGSQNHAYPPDFIALINNGPDPFIMEKGFGEWIAARVKG